MYLGYPLDALAAGNAMNQSLPFSAPGDGVHGEHSYLLIVSARGTIDHQILYPCQRAQNKACRGSMRMRLEFDCQL